MSVALKTQPFGRYHLIERLATSGVSEIWRARTVGAAGFERWLAIKKIHPHLTGARRFTQRLTEEVARAAQLNHANIIHLTDFDQVGGVYYVALELVEGLDLRQVLRSGKERRLPLSVPQATYIACEVLRALSYAHERRLSDGSVGVLHRDITPSSVLISNHGEVRLTGFGIGEIALLEPERGMLPSKLPYVPPEVLMQRPVDMRADLFMLGAVLYEMLTGTACFAGANEAETRENVLSKTPAPPSSYNAEVPPELDAVVLSLLEKDPARRPQKAREVSRGLANYLHQKVTEYQALDLAVFLAGLSAQETAFPQTNRVAHQQAPVEPNFVSAPPSAQTGQIPVVKPASPGNRWLVAVLGAALLLALLYAVALR
jgi:serine/threonine-protein kinase